MGHASARRAVPKKLAWQESKRRASYEGNQEQWSVASRQLSVSWRLQETEGLAAKRKPHPTKGRRDGAVNT